MIISNLIGGLGNQMFQYACGLALSRMRGDAFMVVTDQFDGYGLHQGFELQRAFSLNLREASTAELGKVLGPFRRPQLRRLMAKAPGRLRPAGFVGEPHFHHWPGIRVVPRNAYLHGYWQSEKYFADQGAAIRAAFRFRELQGKDALLLDDIARKPSIGLHVRRGDYVSNARNRGIYAVCDVEYYDRAVSHLIQHGAPERVFAFSDEPAWVRQVLVPKWKHLKVVERSAAPWIDMCLMSACSHFAIANSSFSWWAAWLGDPAQKIVVAPQRWFVSEKVDTRDLVPASWMRL